MPLNSLLFIVAPVVASMALYVGIVTLALKRSRKGRHPIGKDIKLLRQPGEALRQRIEAIDATLSEEIVLGLLVPSLLFFVPLSMIQIPAVAAHFWSVLTLAVIAYLISLGFRCYRAYRLIQERKNHRLGLAGERAVADELEVLKASGYHIFHDVPAQGAKDAFNLDHVVVGPTGVFAIETKARRKYEPKDGGKDYEVGFDGESLLFPNGRETGPVNQARCSAKWLESLIQQRIGRSVAVTPLLAIPGWYTDETPHGGLRVLSQRRLAHHIQRSSPLDAATADLIARQLDTLCRNVPCEG
jgi:hypothetical protein